MQFIKKQLKNLREEFEKKVKDILMGRYPYLYFYISPMGYINVWVRKNGKDGSGIETKPVTIYSFDEEYFDDLNQKIKPASLEPDKYFQCTNCGEVKPLTEYATSVMAAEYCKDCASKPAIRELIKESERNGFYD